MTEYDLLVNGFPVRAKYEEETVTTVFVPLLTRLTELRRNTGKRVIAFLAAPPGAGKSTMAAALEQLSLQTPGVEPVRHVGVDGFHYTKAQLLARTVRRGGVELPMKDVKGCPESYDVPKLRNAILALRVSDGLWPTYDRRIHDVMEDAVAVTGQVVLVEGNWLLLNEGQWADVAGLCDYSIFLRADGEQLRDRLIERKRRGGLSTEEAELFYERSDRPNIAQCLQGSGRADLTLRLMADGSIVRD